MFSIKDTQYDENSKIDLSGYATTATTNQMTLSIEDLKQKVANKLNSNPIDHNHSISQIDQLEQQLNNKLSIPESEETKYSYKTLLKDWDEISYLESVKIPKLDIALDKNTSGYVFNVDGSGDLLISYNDIVIAMYNKAKQTWNFNGINDVLKNHYDALMIILDKLGLKDNDETDGDKVSPVEKVSAVPTEE